MTRSSSLAGNQYVNDVTFGLNVNELGGDGLDHPVEALRHRLLRKHQDLLVVRGQVERGLRRHRVVRHQLQRAEGFASPLDAAPVLADVEGEVVERATQRRVELGADLLDERREPLGLHLHAVRRLGRGPRGLLAAGIGFGDGGGSVGPQVPREVALILQNTRYVEIGGGGNRHKTPALP